MFRGVRKKMAFDLRSLKIYVDGACPKNRGGPGGWCAWVEHPFDLGQPDEFLESHGYFHTTNNRMELRACLFAHEWIQAQGTDLKVQHVQVFTDSQYVCKSYSSSVWWSKNDWCNLDDREMLNVDLWKELLRIRRKIRGHPRVEVIQIPRNSCPLAIKVDEGAKRAAESPQYEDIGYKPGKIGRARSKNTKAAKPYPAAGEEIAICVYKTESTRRGVQAIKFQTYCEEQHDFFEKFWARANDFIGSSLHRGNVYRVRMNDEPGNPRIVEILESWTRKDFVSTLATVTTA